jgi:short-subunit dehydrogenase
MQKTLVISGGTKGIGKAIIEHFAKQGFDIWTCSRNAQDLSALKTNIENTYGTACHIFQADFAKAKDVRAFGKFVLESCPEITVLVNNAGIFQPGSVLQEEEGVFELLMQVNLSSAYHLSRMLVPEMLNNARAHVFNICSTASITPYINGGSYCISKFGLLGMSKVLREELKAHRVAVTSVLPGATYTTSWEGSDLPVERFMPAKDVASAIWQAWQCNEFTVMEELLLRPHEGDL